MKLLSAVSLLATASVAIASLRGGPAVLSKAVLSAVPAIPAPFFFMADSIGEGEGTCETETDTIWSKDEFLDAMDGLYSCDATLDEEKKTGILDFSSCNATAAATTACSCEFVFHLGNEISS